MRQPVPSAGAGRACMGGVAGLAGKHQILAFQHLCALMPHACGMKPCYCMFISTHMGIRSSPAVLRRDGTCGGVSCRLNQRYRFSRKW